MKQPHKHAELIKAWADGAEIEYWNESQNQWKEARTPNWDARMYYRIKPEPKPDVVKYVKEHMLVRGEITYACDANLRLTFDGETRKLKKAEVLE